MSEVVGPSGPLGDPRFVGVLLAGGQGLRMGGGDKCLRSLGDQPLLAHVIARLRPQVGAMVLNANGDPARFREFGLPVAGDSVAGFAGPLAGVLAGLEWAQAAVPEAQWVVSVPTDGPFLPTDLVARLFAAILGEEADLASAAYAGQAYPVVGLWPIRLAEALRRAIVDEDIRKVDRWTARYRLATVAVPALQTREGPVDPFFNANTPEDLATAARILGQLQSD